MGTAFYLEMIWFWNAVWCETLAVEGLPRAQQFIQTGGIPAETARNSRVQGVYLQIGLYKKEIT